MPNLLDAIVQLLSFAFAASALLLSLWAIYLVMRAHARIDASRRGRGAYGGAEQPPARPLLPPVPPAAPPQPATDELESQDAPTQQIRAQRAERPHLPRPGRDLG